MRHVFSLNGLLWIVVGALGLILPGVTHVKPWLTPLAAVGLTLVTICAAVYQSIGQQPESAVFALVLGTLPAFVAYGRTRLAPLAVRPVRRAQVPA